MADLVFHTSGSTGEPKTIVRTQAQLARDGAAIARVFASLFAPAAAFVASIRTEHFYGALWCVEVPAALGLSCDPEVITGVEQLTDLVARHGRVVFLTTPSFLEKALAHPDFPTLRGGIAAIVTSGSALRQATAVKVMELVGVSPLEIYGSTETGTIGWRQRSQGEELWLFDGVEAESDADGRLKITTSPYAMEIPWTMSDSVRFTAPRRFELLGRTDRRVKVLEDFVSLAVVEQAFGSHPFIAAARAEAYGEGVPRIGLIAVLSESGRAALAQGTFASVIASLRRDLAAQLPPPVFPRRIRFLREIPVDGRGKTPVALVRQALMAGCREPVVTSWTVTAARLEAKLVFPADAEVFDGHFPGFPVLPGVAQLFFLRHFARQAFADYPDVANYRKLKFRRVVRPAEELSLSVERIDAGQFTFRLAVGDDIAASGIVEGGC